MAFPTRTATLNGQAAAALQNAAASAGVSIAGLSEVDAIAICVANLFDQLANASAGQGYLPGSGTTATQATNKSTGVTMNTITGVITMNNAALTNAVAVTFTVTNNVVAATDIITVIHASGGTAGSYIVGANTPVAATSFKITVYNCSAGPLSEAIVLNYMIERGSAN
jgi:hypothetical protein